MQKFTELRVWHGAQDLACEVYRVSRAFPAEEKFGMIYQLRRAAVSVSSNIAEGSKRLSPADYARFINMAEGSLNEVESLLHLARRLSFISPNDLEALQSRITPLERMLHALRSRIQSASA